MKSFRHAISVIILCAAVLALLTACNGNVEAFSAHVVRTDGTIVNVSMEDLLRRSSDEEAFIAATPSDAPVVFRVDPRSEGLPMVRSLVVHAQGAIDTAEIIIATANEELSYRFAISDFYRSAPNNQTGRYTIRLTLDQAIALPGAELRFRSDSDQGFQIAGVDFGEGVAEPMVELAEDDASVTFLDSRLPIVRTQTSILVEGVDQLGARWVEGDAIELEYRQSAAVFVDHRDRPHGMIELLDDSGNSRLIEMRIRPGQRVVTLRPMMWDIEPVSISITSEVSGFALRTISGSTVPEDPLDAISVELTELQTYPTSLWRRSDFELFSWSIYPNILWFDSIDYATQARLFRRLAFFVEKRGFQGRLLTDEELAVRHGWNAHNYRPEGLADFFNAVQRENFPINSLEQELQEIILHHGVIVEDPDGTYVPGVGGILAISQESWPELRSLLTAHEAMHGVFYEEEAFRAEVFDYWENSLSARERTYWQDFLAWMSYSPDDTYLMVNEFQGYLLQQSEEAIMWYFRTRIANRLRTRQPARVDEINLFLRDHPETFVRSGDAMNASIFRIAGIVGGDPWCLVPIEPVEPIE